MNCPFCDKLVEDITTSDPKECDQKDHIFWMHNGIWYILHIHSNLFIDYMRLCLNIPEAETLMELDNISPQEAGIILKKYLKLKAFL